MGWLCQSYFYHNDWTTNQSVITNDTTSACHPMVSTKGLHPWMATTIEVICIASLPTSVYLIGTVCIDGAMDSQQYPVATGWMATQCLMSSVMTIGPVAVEPASSVSVMLTLVSIVLASKECVRRCAMDYLEYLCVG
jgi:hypothetical protein